MFAAKQFDPVMGVDIHLIQLPAPGPPVPLPHPFIGMVFDPMSFLPPQPPIPPLPPILPTPSNEAAAMVQGAVMQAIIPGPIAMIMNPPTGASVFINMVPHGITGTSVKGMPHIPMGGAFVPPPSNSGEIFMGSMTVLSENSPLSRLGMMSLSCQSIGMPTPPRKMKKPKSPGVGMFLPLSVVLAIPLGRPVLVGGPPTIDFKALAQKILNKAAGKLVGKLKKAASKKIHNAAAKAMDKKGVSQSTRDRVHRSICAVTGHPVDIATGKVFTETIDFELVGVIPLEWERVWFSTSDFEGNMGHGWHHLYGATLVLDASEKAAALRLPDGRVELLPYFEGDESVMLKKEQISFFRKDNRFGYFEFSTGLLHWFSMDYVGKEGFHPLVKIENQYLQCIEFQYASNGDLIQIVDSAKRILTVTNDSNHRIRKIQTMHPVENQLFSLVEYDYDAIGNLIQSRNALGQPMTYRYEKHLLVQETDANGLSFYFKYDGDDSNARCLQTWGDKGIYNHQLKYDLENKCTTVTNSLGYETNHFYNDLGVVIKQVNPDDSTLLKTYSDDAELLSETDELGRVTRYAYDDFANVILETRPDGIVLKSNYEWGLLKQFEDAVGGKWMYSYNDKRQLIQKIDPLNRVTKYQYDVVSGLLQTITDPIGQKTGFEYDAFNNLSKVILPDQTAVTWAYDVLGRVIQIADIKGNQQNIYYDLIGSVKKVQEADGNIRYLDYDAMGNLTRARDRQQDIQLSYSGMNKLASRTQAGTRVEFHYDTEEQLIGIKNEHGFAYRFDLDNRGNVVTEIGFDGVTRNYKRDVAGQISEIRRGIPSRMLFQKNAVLSSKYQYDKLGQVIDIQHNDGTSEQYNYREDGVLMMAKNLHATVRFERNILGTVLKEFQNEDWVSSKYDLVGNRIGLESSFGAKMVFGRNDMGDIMNLSANGLTEKWEASFQRDLAGLEIQREMTGGIKSGWKRDALGRPLEQETFVGGSLKRHKKYEWDVNDRLKSIRDLVKGDNHSVKFGHDALGNLAWAEYGAGQFEYRMPDAVGNLFKTKSRTDRKYGPAGQLLEADGTHFEYDIEGNLIRKTESNGNLWRYDWNAAGFLAHVLRPDGTFVSFTYDALGRRLSKTHLNKTTCWIWDGNVPLHEWEEPTDYYPDVDAPELVGKVFNNLTTWVFEPESFVPIAKLTDFGRYSIVTDHLGTPATMFDDAGKEIWSVDLNTYGGVRRSLGDTNDCPFRYQGQYEDVETGLYYNRFRYYDPQAGQYISSDPIGLLGHNPSLYAYVKEPNLYIDELGLSCGPTKFHKRSVKDVAKMRKAFDKSGGAREKFLKKLAKDPKSVKKYGKTAVEQMKKGQVPSDMVVHHKKPLFRGGTNSHSNLDLIDKKYHSDNNKDLHWYPEGQNPYNLN